jgi:hypothetical protein
MRITLTVIFNVVAGMIFLRQTPETYPRQIMALALKQHSVASSNQVQNAILGEDEMRSRHTHIDAACETAGEQQNLHRLL